MSDDVLADRVETAELRRLERLLEQRRLELDELQAKADLRRPVNRRYNIDFTFPFQADPSVDFIYTEDRSAAIAKGTRFFVKTLEMGFQITSTGATFNMGPLFMKRFFDFQWRIRDTGTDREWSNDWLPSEFLYSGDVRGLALGRNHCLVSGGTDLTASVRVTRSKNPDSLFTSIEAFGLQIGFVGVEVPEDFEEYRREEGGRGVAVVGPRADGRGGVL